MVKVLLQISPTATMPLFNISFSAVSIAAKICSSAKCLSVIILKTKSTNPVFSGINPFKCDNSKWQCAFIKPGQSRPSKNSISSPASFKAIISFTTPLASVIKTLPCGNMACPVKILWAENFLYKMIG